MAKTKNHRRNLPSKTIAALQKQKAAVWKQISVPPEYVRASYVKQYLTCGKKNCRCAQGFKHGPFYYLTQCLGTGRTEKFLLKTAEQKKAARAGIAAHKKLQHQIAELSKINTELLRLKGQ